MKKVYFAAAGLAVLLGSCSQDEIAGLGTSESNEIKYSVVANGLTRAAAIYHNNGKPAGFHVSATTEQGGEKKVYIADDEIENTGTGGTEKWTNTTGTCYWPESAVDFYAHVNGDGVFNLNGGAPTFKDFTVDATVADQKDLLYAVKTGQTRTADADQDADPVTLNFRHALSQIVFNARNDSKNLSVKIDGIKVLNVGNKSTYTFPTASTDPNVADASTDNRGATTGSWGAVEGKTTYGVTLSPAASVVGKTDGSGKAVKGDLVDLTSGAAQAGLAMLLMPQTTTAWKNETEAMNSTAGSYLLVKCAIVNEPGGTVADEDKVVLWGEEDGSTKELAIPIAFNWAEGKKYIYTLVFGNGNGGYDPEDPDNPDPDPVLVPISYEVTVDEFLDGGSTDVESGITDGSQSGSGD